MFSLDIVNSDAFLDLPVSAQNLYFHIAMRADDDGFLSNPNAIKRIVSASDEDLKTLIQKRFLLSFPSGIVAIKHWKIHNTIQKDRYKKTVHTKEFEQLDVKENNAYTEKNKTVYTLETECIQNVSNMETQYRLEQDKIRLDIPPISPKGEEPVKKAKTDSFSESFKDFWKAYPKKASKTNALKEWKKIKPNDDLVRVILDALERQKKSAQWQKEDGQFIPYPAKWLKEKRWEDYIESTAETPSGEHSYNLNDYKSLVNNFGDSDG